MTLYRARHKLAKGGTIIGIGKTTTLDWLTEEERQKMIDVGAVTVVPRFPLSMVPGFGWQAARLERVGYEDAEQFLAADTGEVAGLVGYRADTIERWKGEVKTSLEIEEEYTG